MPGLGSSNMTDLDEGCKEEESEREEVCMILCHGRSSSALPQKSPPCKESPAPVCSACSDTGTVSALLRVCFPSEWER